MPGQIISLSQTGSHGTKQYIVNLSASGPGDDKLIKFNKQERAHHQNNIYEMWQKVKVLRHSEEIGVDTMGPRNKDIDI